MKGLWTGLALLLGALPLAAQETAPEGSEATAQSPTEAAGQEPEEGTRLPVRVVSVVGESVFLDVGRDQGLRAGDRLRLMPSGGAELEVVVLAVSANQSRVALPAGSDPAGVLVGTPGEVVIPAGRVPAGAGAASTVEHPPWTATPEEWASDQPLLAPAVPLTARDRDVDLRGFAYLTYDTTRDDSSSYSLARTGVDLEAENLFGQGGIAQLDVDAWTRASSVGNIIDDETSHLTLRRLSYLWGGLRDEQQSVEVGRFMQRLTPEFGVLDGAEFAWRLDSGDMLGFSFGYLPDWTPEMQTGDDLSVSTTWRHLAGAEDELELSLGLQKTWFQGEADRDLAVGTLSWNPGTRTRLFASAWVDYYDGGELIKDQGFELTQGTFNLTRQIGTSSGASLFASHILRPDLLDSPFTPVPPVAIQDYDVTRLGTTGWTGLGEKSRLSARVDLWSNTSDDGYSGELRLGRRDLLAERDELALTLFLSQGEYTNATGGRLGWTRWLQAGYLNLGLEGALYEQRDFSGDLAELWQYAATLGFDRDLGELWDLGLWLDYRFGDELNATSAGVSLRRRF